MNSKKKDETVNMIIVTGPYGPQGTTVILNDYRIAGVSQLGWGKSVTLKVKVSDIRRAIDGKEK